MYLQIPATEDQPHPQPPMSGSWVRQPDGSLAPADDATAQAAGLLQPAAPEVPEPPQPPEKE